MLRPEHELNDLTGIEVPSDEFPVRGEFLEGHDGEVVGFHDRVAYGSDAFEKVLGVGSGGARKGLNEDDAGIWLLVAGIEALDTEWHFDGSENGIRGLRRGFSMVLARTRWPGRLRWLHDC